MLFRSTHTHTHTHTHTQSRRGAQNAPVVAACFCGLVIAALQVASFTLMSKIWTGAYCGIVLWIVASFVKLRVKYPPAKNAETEFARPFLATSTLLGTVLVCVLPVGVVLTNVYFYIAGDI